MVKPPPRLYSRKSPVRDQTSFCFVVCSSEGGSREAMSLCPGSQLPPELGLSVTLPLPVSPPDPQGPPRPHLTCA